MRITIALSYLFIVHLVNAQNITWTAAGDGLSWNDPDNWDILAVPGANNDVIIEADSVVIAGMGANAGSVSINQGRLHINSSLTIANADTFGIFCLESTVVNLGTLTIIENGMQFELEHAVHLDSSRLINRGTFEVVETAGRGIYIDAQSAFLNKGMAQISNALDRGIFAAGLLDNHDTIIISNTSFSPYLVQDTCYNRTNAYMEAVSIDKLGNHGISQFGVLINNGHIVLTDIEASGIYNAGSLFNYERIDIDSAGDGISNEDTIINMIGAEIGISNIDNEGLINAFNTSQHAQLENAGQIILQQIAGPAIVNRAYLSILDSGGLQVEQGLDLTLEVVEGAIFLVEGELLIMN